MRHPGPLVLRTNPLNSPTPTADRDRTVSRRSEPSSRTTLIGEQPNPWELLHPQDVMSRHRGAKRCRRYGLFSGIISLLSPAYLLSVERWPFHAGPPDRYLQTHLLSCCIFAVRQAYPCTQRAISSSSEPTIERLRYSLGSDHPVQTATMHCPAPDNRNGEISITTGSSTIKFIELAPNFKAYGLYHERSQIQ